MKLEQTIQINKKNNRKTRFLSLLNVDLTLRVVLTFIAMFVSSCEEYLDIEPPSTSLSGETVFEGDQTVEAAMVGIYINMMSLPMTIMTGQESIAWLMGLYSDELINYSTDENQVEFFTNDVLSINRQVEFKWNEFYRYIYTANSIIEGLENSENVSEPTKNQIAGEARFIRAFCYFYLLNMYGEVPISTSTDFDSNSVLSQSSIDQIHERIIEDLEIAKESLSDAYFGNGRTRPNRFTAIAMLARVYLYLGRWESAESEANQIIESGLYNIEPELNNVFLTNSNEAIWQLQTVRDFFDTFEGPLFILFSSPSNVSLNPNLVNSYESGDLRLENWIGSFSDDSQTYFFPFKYKVDFSEEQPVEYLTVLRLAEQYLIRAEAKYRLGRPSEAVQDLNIIRNRAGLQNSPIIDLNVIENERRLELFTEFGHRFFDLKRFGKLDAVIGSAKPSWQTTDSILPIPEEELNRNPNLIQNDGY